MSDGCQQTARTFSCGTLSGGIVDALSAMEHALSSVAKHTTNHARFRWNHRPNEANSTTLTYRMRQVSAKQDAQVNFSMATALKRCIAGETMMDDNAGGFKKSLCLAKPDFAGSRVSRYHAPSPPPPTRPFNSTNFVTVSCVSRHVPAGQP